MGQYAEDPPACYHDTVCQSLNALPSLAYLAAACVFVLLCVAVVAQRGFRRADQNRRLFVLPLVVVAPALLVTIQDWAEVMTGNARKIASGEPPLPFPPPWMLSQLPLHLPPKFHTSLLPT